MALTLTQYALLAATANKHMPSIVQGGGENSQNTIGNIDSGNLADLSAVGLSSNWKEVGVPLDKVYDAMKFAADQQHFTLFPGTTSDNVNLSGMAASLFVRCLVPRCAGRG